MTISSNDNTRRDDAPFFKATQSSRFLEINSDWFFFTREKDLLGPYRTQLIAEHAVKIYAKNQLKEAITSVATSLTSRADSSTARPPTGPAGPRSDATLKADLKAKLQQARVINAALRQAPASKEKSKVASAGQEKSNVILFKHPNWNV